MKLEKILNLIEPPISGEWGIDVSELSENVAKVIRTTNFTNIGKIDYAKEVVLREIEEKKIMNKKLLYGDIIVEKSGGSPTQPVGRVVYFDLDTDENYLCNNFTSVLRPKNDKVHSKYLFWMLFYQHLSKKTLNFQNKTTGIINLQLDRYVKNIQIPLPPLEIQKKIADTLDKAGALIDKRKEQISALDKFLENLFLDMFGDPVSNTMGWEVKEFGKLITTISDVGSNGSNEMVAKYLDMKDTEDYSMMIRTVNFTANNFLDNMKYITEELYNRFSKTKLYGGEIIMNKIGSAGNLWLMPYLNRPVSLGLNQFLIRVEGVSNIFLYKYLKTEFITKDIKSRTKGAVTKSITKGEVKKIPIFLPPLDLQNQFTSIVKKVEVEKIKLESSLTEMEDNFNSIMQRAFKGELF